LGKRLIYFESPHLFEQAERRVIEDDISARRRGDGKYATAPWMTISRALSELGSIEGGRPISSRWVSESSVARRSSAQEG